MSIHMQSQGLNPNEQVAPHGTNQLISSGSKEASVQ